MKTQQEIEQLAEKYAESFRLKISSSSWHEEKCDDFINGYTQCQEDMADEIKKAIEYGYQLRNNNKPINSGIDWVKEFNSLNKQD